MQIFIKAPNGKTTTLEMSETETIDNLKVQVNHKCGLPLDEMRLVFEGKLLEGEGGKTLQDYEITNDSTIHSATKARGG